MESETDVDVELEKKFSQRVDEIVDELEHDEAEAEANELILVNEKKIARRELDKPDIDRLHDAIVYLEDETPVFVPDVGERVLIERRATCLPGSPWLDTVVYLVHSVDHESGDVRLWNERSKQWSITNFVLGPKRGYRYKLPTQKFIRQLSTSTKIMKKIEKIAKNGD